MRERQRSKVIIIREGDEQLFRWLKRHSNSNKQI